MEIDLVPVALEVAELVAEARVVAERRPTVEVGHHEERGLHAVAVGEIEGGVHLALPCRRDVVDRYVDRHAPPAYFADAFARATASYSTSNITSCSVTMSRFFAFISLSSAHESSVI